MLQLTQKLKNGAMQVLEVPIPALLPGTLLVRNRYSLISAGTEGSTVKAARSSLLEKARSRPQQVRQVVETLMSQGITQTYRAVMKKLDAYSSLGYSCSGQVVDVAQGVHDVNVGDLVACAGLSACHAEYVTVPRNLCVVLRPDADLGQAAYNTLGAIAMQGVRQADLRLGESCAVIGMGLLGQLTALILRVSGVRTVGIDIDAAMLESASKHCLDLALMRNEAGITRKIEAFTDGLGCDAVIITAATSSLDPINFAGSIARKRATVVVVGAVPTGFDRDPHYYRKELQVRMSCSYGPGRYDPSYEEKGIDYPAAFVRWTENRNMQAFQELIATKKIDPGYLTTHTFKQKDAPAAYALLLEKSAPFIGILLEYDVTSEVALSRVKVGLREAVSSGRGTAVGVGFIGAGSYAQSHLLPNLPREKDVVLKGVMTATGTGARSVGERFGFEFCACDEAEIIAHAEINTVFIASRHDSHAGYVLQALKAGKNVFVEKPLCLTLEELNEIESLYTSLFTLHSSPPLLMVGFNRRFSPLAAAVKKELKTGPMAMHYRINAGSIPRESWIQDPETGGGRIIGEACHFIDFLTYMNGSLPVSVHSAAMRTAAGLNDTVNISLTFQNGSIGTVSYFANGDRGLAKERVEIFADGAAAVIDDFRTLSIYSRGKREEKKLLVQDKGQKAEVIRFIEAIRTGAGPLIPFAEIASVTLAALKALESTRSGERIDL